MTLGSARELVGLAAAILALTAPAAATAETRVKKAAKTGQVASAQPEKSNPEEQFQTFCGEWMKKLAARERDNEKQIHWVPDGGGVEAEYVGYSVEHSCVLKPNENPKAVPVGKIIYMEIRYQKRAPSIAQADAVQPSPLEVTEVTEIFRYGKDKWEY